MSFWLSAVWLLAVQVSNPPGAEAAGAAGGAGREAPVQEPGIFSSLIMFLPMMLAIMIVYMLIMKSPQQRDDQRMKTLLADLKKNDKVILAGGIVAWISNFNADSEYVTVRIDESTNTKMQVLKQSIVRVVKEKSEDSDKKA